MKQGGVILLIILLSTSIWAITPPDRINYQGVLRDSSGSPLTGDVEMVFRFYDRATGGALLWEEQYDASVYPPALTVENGLFSVALGDPAHYVSGLLTDFTVIFSDYNSVYLALEIDSDTEMTPRIEIKSTPYSVNADKVDGYDASEFAASSHTHDSWYLRKNHSDVAAGQISFTAPPKGTSVADATLDISPTSVSSDYTLFGIQNPSDELFTVDAEGDVSINGQLGLNGSMLLDKDGPDQSQYVYFYDSGTPDAEYIGWYDTYSTFTVSDSLAISGAIRTGNNINISSYNHFGDSGSVSSGAISTNRDVYVAEDLEIDGAAYLNGSLYLDDNGPQGDQYIYFYNDSSNVAEYLQWDETNNMFHFSTDLSFDGNLYTTGLTHHINWDGPDASQYIYFYENGNSQQEYFAWYNTNNCFIISDKLSIAGAIRTGTDSATQSYNHFGVSGSPSSYAITSTHDVYIQEDLELDGSAYLNGSLYMDDDGPDGFQYIYFYENGNSSQEYFGWNDASNLFYMSDDCFVLGEMVVNTNITGNNIFAQDNLTLSDTLYMDGFGPDGDQWIYFWNNNSKSGESLGFNDGADRFELSNDLYVGGDLKVEGIPQLNGTLYMDDDGPDGFQYIYFYENGNSSQEYFGWNDASNLFYMSDDCFVLGEMVVDSNITGNDFLVQGALTLSDTLYMNGFGPDGDQWIYFWNHNSGTGESLGFDDGLDRFEFTDDLFIIGDLDASGTKSFIQNHPYDDSLAVVYVALEGDEAGTYTRGTGRLQNGVARIPLNEAFSLVTNPDIGLTASVTPRGQCQGMFVESITTEEIVVRELNNGQSNAPFDFLVFGLRIGYETKSIYREKTSEAKVPTREHFERQYDKHPEFYESCPLERFKQMDLETGNQIKEDFSASEDLKSAIGQYDPNDPDLETLDQGKNSPLPLSSDIDVITNNDDYDRGRE